MWVRALLRAAGSTWLSERLPVERRATTSHRMASLGGKPVGLLTRAGVLALKIQVQRAIPIGFERHPTAQGEAVEAVRNLEASRGIERDRPERRGGRGLALCDVDRVLACAIERRQCRKFRVW